MKICIRYLVVVVASLWHLNLKTNFCHQIWNLRVKSFVIACGIKERMSLLSQAGFADAKFLGIPIRVWRFFFCYRFCVGNRFEIDWWLVWFDWVWNCGCNRTQAQNSNPFWDTQNEVKTASRFWNALSVWKLPVQFGSRKMRRFGAWNASSPEIQFLSTIFFSHFFRRKIENW